MKLTRKLRSLTSHRRSAADVAAAAGTADNPLRRRGSVLVLVLGALALISVVTLVYVTVGKGDIRTSAVIVDRSNVDAAVSSISDHLNSVIANSTVATFVDGYEGTTPITIRKAWDYPFVDGYSFPHTRKSVTANTYEAFNPSGSYADPVTGVDRRLPYQPWLSTTLPTDLLGAGLSSADPPDPLDPEDAKDWGMFSNFAPDGRFVNLWNLAPYLGGQRISRFNAYSVQPGSNGNPTIPLATDPLSSEMSYGVTLLDPTSGRSYDAGASLLPDGTTALPNVPAHWTMRQLRAMRLAGRDRFFGPSQYQYGPYQYCDADGDGFFDSRWIELVNATDPDNPISLLPRDDRFRWFVAARAVDLNALVNINTATDMRLPARPTTGATSVQVTPQGLSASDIDLFRILRMDDTYQVYGFGYDQLERFVTNPQSDFYNGAYDLDLARDMGHRAYNGIRQALTFNNVKVAAPGDALVTTPAGPLAALTGDARFQYYQFWGAQPTASYYIAAGAKRFSLSGQFGDADLLELLSYRGVNNPRITSRLEQVTDGRMNPFTPDGAGTLDESRMGPMRSDRSAEKEIGTADNDGTGNQGDGEADRDAFIRLAADIRKLLTTISHDRQFSSAYRTANRAAHYPVPPATTVTLGKLTGNDLTRDAIDAAAEAPLSR